MRQGLICLLLFIVYSCRPSESVTLLHHKYQVMQYKDTSNTFLLATFQQFQVDFSKDSTIYVYAEDNVLSANYRIINDSVLLSNATMTDVCCNSDTANRIFDCFDSSLRWQQKGDTLLLQAAKAQLQLVVFKN